MTNDAFKPLSVALKDYFSKPLRELPEDLRALVKGDFFGLDWDKFTAEKRQVVAAQWDQLHCPETIAQINRIDDFGNEYKKAKDAVDTWQTRVASTAIEQAVKDDRLKAAQARLDELDAQHKRLRGDYVGEGESGPVPEKKARQRIDAMRDAIEEAIELTRLAHGDTWKPHQLMTMLMTFAGRPGSRITGVVEDGVEWRDERGDTHVLDMDALRQRLKRRSERIASRSPMPS